MTARRLLASHKVGGNPDALNLTPRNWPLDREQPTAAPGAAW